MTVKEPGSHRVDRPDSGVEIFRDDDEGREGEARDPQERPPDHEVEDIEAERERRLDAGNRPDGAEVDNTHRDFDPAVGMFTDSDGYESGEPRYDAAPEGGGGA